MARGQYVQPLTIEKAKSILIKVILEKLVQDMGEEESQKLVVSLPKLRKATTVKELVKALGNSSEVLNLLIQ